ncbi:MAG: hypothetical protein PVI90_00505 [Desulfobacteraceae bacterium]|jgi:hypothetical protein
MVVEWECSSCQVHWDHGVATPKRKLTLYVEKDLKSVSPRENKNNLSIITCLSPFGDKRNKLYGDPHSFHINEYYDWLDFNDCIEKEGARYLKRLYVFYTKGIAQFSLIPPFWPKIYYMVGYMYTTTDRLNHENMGYANVSFDTIKSGVDDVVYHVFDAELSDYNSFLRGDVWGFIIKDEDGKSLEEGLGFLRGGKGERGWVESDGRCLTFNI